MMQRTRTTAALAAASKVGQTFLSAKINAGRNACVILAVTLTLVTSVTHAATFNVSGGGSALQTAINTASTGDILRVAPDTYSPITSNNKLIRIEATGSVEATIIDGGNKNRCATLGSATGENNTVLIGFTLQNGKATTSSSGGANGGGARYGTLNNCVIKNNTAGNNSGGASGCILNNCVIKNNTADNYGGGARGGTLNNCLVEGNKADKGGGVDYATLNNCTVVKNTATTKDSSGQGGGVRDCTVNNSIVWGNYRYDWDWLIFVGNYVKDSKYSNNSTGSNYHYSCMPSLDNPTSTTKDPKFVGFDGGDYRLQPGSPCIDTGLNTYADGITTDLRGNPRISNDRVDMGAYECRVVNAIFSGNGGYPANQTVAQGYDHYYRLPSPDPTRTGYLFSGWYTAANGGSIITSTKVTQTTTHTIFAQWTAKKTTITFNANGGTGGPSGNYTATYGQDMPWVYYEIPTRTGYIFTGYYDTSATTGGTQYYTSDGYFPVPAQTWYKEVTSQILYARWSNTYTVTFNSNHSYATPRSQTVTQTCGNKYILPPNPIRPDYLFSGWFTGGSGSGRQITTNTTVTETPTYTLYAYWKDAPSFREALNYTSLDGYGWSTWGSVSMYGDWVVQTSTTHDGVLAAQSGAITHNQYSRLQTTVSGPGLLTFWWKVDSEAGYDKLKFYIDGVEQPGSISGNTAWAQKSFSISTGTHTLQWSYEKDEKISVGSDCGWLDEVSWTPAIYTVTLDKDGGTGGTSSVTTRYGEPLPTSGVTAPSKTGYVFDGYFEYPNGVGAQYYTSTMDTYWNWGWDKTQNTTLYAKWTAKTATVTFNANGGTGGPGGSCVATYGQLMPSVYGIPTRAGYTFAGYYDYDTSVWGGTQYYTTALVPTQTWNKEVTSQILYASWTQVATLNTPCLVPFSWLDQWGGNSSNYETLAKSKGANGYFYWESYVAGLSPTDANSKFSITNFVVQSNNGKDAVTALVWSPDLRPNRVYTVWGKTNLTDGAWHFPTNDASRFFKVDVKLP